MVLVFPEPGSPERKTTFFSVDRSFLSSSSQKPAYFQKTGRRSNPMLTIVNILLQNQHRIHIFQENLTEYSRSVVVHVFRPYKKPAKQLLLQLQIVAFKGLRK